MDFEQTPHTELFDSNSIIESKSVANNNNTILVMEPITGISICK